MKTILKLSVSVLILMTGFGFISCTNGENLGMGGSGNLNIIDIPSQYNNKFMDVSITDGGTYTFKERIKISKGKVKAPLYNGLTQYTGTTLSAIAVTATIYKAKTGSDTEYATNSIGTVKFYAGSGVIYWP